MTTPVRSRRGKPSPPRTSDCRAAYGGSPYGNRLNCWEPLKPRVPQHGDETGPDVTVAKAEKNVRMVHGASLYTGKMGDQQPSPEQGKVQRLSFAGVGPGGPKRSAPRYAGEDIVCAHVKAWGVRLLDFMGWGRTGAATRCEQKRMKQLMAGGGIALVGATLIPLLSGLFG